MSDTHTWNVSIAGEVIGVIDAATVYYSGPFEPGQEYVSVADLYVKNTGTMAGKIWIKLYEYPGEANEGVVTGPMYTTPDVQPGETRPVLFYVSTPSTPGAWPLGLKVWGDDESEPSWSLGLQNGQAHIFGLNGELPPWVIPAVALGGLLGICYLITKK